MLVKAKARYTDLLLDKEIMMGATYNIDDADRVKLLVEKGLVTVVDPSVFRDAFAFAPADPKSVTPPVTTPPNTPAENPEKDKK